MRFGTLIRSSSALWISPLAILLVVFFYHETGSTLPVYGWAPTVVASAELATVSLSYAVAAGLGAWESGRLTSARIWQLAPTRSPYRIAAESLSPIVALTWLMHVVAVSVACVHTGVAPTWDGSRALIISLPLCASYSVVGFAVGLRLKRYLSAPLIASLVWVVTAMAWSIGAPWPRQISGVFPRTPDLGEVISWHAVVPHLLAMGGIAAAIGLLWLRAKRPIRIGMAVVTALAGTLGSYAMVRGWGYAPPMQRVAINTVCVGASPRICMPEESSRDIDRVQREAMSTVDQLAVLNIGARPASIADSMLRGRQIVMQSPILYVPLAQAARSGTVKLTVMLAAVKFPCKTPALAQLLAVRSWVADKTGQGVAYEKLLRGQLALSSNPEKLIRELRDAVNTILKLSTGKQYAWYEKALRDACVGNG